jgi:hypothetical protein
MYVWQNLKTTKFYLTKLATDFYWQQCNLLGERVSLGNALVYAPTSLCGIQAYGVLEKFIAPL